MNNTDEDAIREMELRFNEAWGRHDAGGMVESLTDDAQFVTVNGAWTKTRAEYLDLHADPGDFVGAERLGHRRRQRRNRGTSNSDDELAPPHRLPPTASR
jgi:hypothetical protein